MALRTRTFGSLRLAATTAFDWPRIALRASSTMGLKRSLSSFLVPVLDFRAPDSTASGETGKKTGRGSKKDSHGERHCRLTVRDIEGLMAFLGGLEFEGQVYRVCAGSIEGFLDFGFPELVELPDHGLQVEIALHRLRFSGPDLLQGEREEPVVK